jgi:hypothetical protein
MDKRTKKAINFFGVYVSFSLRDYQIKGNVILTAKKIATSEKTINGGNHSIVPLLPKTNSKATNESAVIRQVANVMQKGCFVRHSSFP